MADVAVQGGYNGMYVFGDSISTTTNNTSPYPSATNFYGKRFTNGRVWVEVLAQRQGLAYNPNNNNSFFGNYSSTLLTTLNNFQPANASNALVVIWVNNADLYYDWSSYGTNLASWTNAMGQSISNHFKIVTNLYSKNIRTLVMPNAVDITQVPFVTNPDPLYRNFIRQRCLDYNNLFATALNRAKTNCPGLMIFVPDFFSLLTNLVAYPANYGLTNALLNGLSIDALDNPALKNLSPNGPGTNYIFWDDLDPTAMVHMWMANLAQQMISPAQIASIAMFGDSNRLDLVNVPIGQDGLVLGCTNMISPWITNATFTSSTSSQSVFVLTTSLDDTNTVSQGIRPNDGPPMPPGGGTGSTNPVPATTIQLYSLRFPYVWSWP